MWKYGGRKYSEEGQSKENVGRYSYWRRSLHYWFFQGGIFSHESFLLLIVPHVHVQATLRDIFKVKPDVQPTEQIQNSAVEQQTEGIFFSSKQMEDVSFWQVLVCESEGLIIYLVYSFCLSSAIFFPTVAVNASRGWDWCSGCQQS